MKNNISKSKMTRAGAIILAVITLLSTIFIIPANAATGDPATITFDYACRPDMSKGCFSSQSSTMSTCSSM